MGDGRTGEPQANHERLTVAQAAVSLGITEGAVRSRIKRGTLPTAKEGARVFVLLGGGTAQANQTQAADVPDARTDALIDELRDRVRALEEANSENRRIIAALTSRIPAIEAPPGASGSPETAEEEAERVRPHSDAPSPQEATRSPWWRRIFGGRG